MRGAFRLTSSYDFQSVYQDGRAIHNKHVVLHVLERLDNRANRVAFVVGKRVGLATARNRIKRLMREAYRASEKEAKGAHDLIFVARRSLKGKSCREVESILRGALKKAGLLESQ